MSIARKVHPAYWVALSVAAVIGAVVALRRDRPPPMRGSFAAIDGTPTSGIRLEPRWDLGIEATFIGSAVDGSGRLFVVEKAGRIWVVRAGEDDPRLFLDIRDRVHVDASERGLFSVAFPADHRETSAFYVYYTGGDQADVVISRFSGDEWGGRANPDSEEVLLRIPETWSNHNGGQLQFGPDGCLYAGIGDGGAGGDPHDVAEDLGSPLGKLLRLDVAAPEPSAPASNPFVDQLGAVPEIWAYGLRNPWRFSFDRETGDLWVADVGQAAWEEIDHVPVGTAAGVNFGWDTMEGNHCFEPAVGCDDEGRWSPIHEYAHDLGCSITGGYVYRGGEIEELEGDYVFADFCAGTIWALRPRETGALVRVLAEGTDLHISSFGEGPAGELFVVDLRGWVFEVVSG